jgi:Domain of unknown function (DUF4386)
MSTSGRIDRAIGFLLLLVAGLTVGGFLVGASLGEVDPFARGDVVVMLRTVNDHFGQWVVSLAAYIATDVLVISVAAGLFLAFQDRGPLLALAGAFSLVAAAVLFMVHEAGAMTLAFLAQDFLADGGPGGVPAGDQVILETTRAVSVAQALAALFGQTLMGVGVLAFGALMIWAPAGSRNPPRWIGVAGVLGGASMLATWLFVVDHLAGGGVTLLAELAIVVMLVALGTWLVRHPGHRLVPGQESLVHAVGAPD